MRRTVGRIVVLAGMLLWSGAAWGSIVQDDFNRDDNGTLGTASDGTNVWTQSQPWSKFSISGQTLQVFAGAQSWADGGNAYIGELKDYANVTESFKFYMGSSTGSGDAWLKIAPCGGDGGGTLSYPGWMFRYDGVGSVNLSYWDGYENGVGSGICSADTWVDITIAITGNTSTLTIGGTTYNTPGGMGLGRPLSAEHFRLDFYVGSSNGIAVNLDDLNIVPEPATIVLAALGGLLAALRKRR